MSDLTDVILNKHSTDITDCCGRITAISSNLCTVAVGSKEILATPVVTAQLEVGQVAVLNKISESYFIVGIGRYNEIGAITRVDIRG